jgi:SAM-dependent methyltransferase
VAKSVRWVYACDLSLGALACARVLNSADNVEYLTADESGFGKIADASLHVVCSFAVIQHVTDEGLEQILAICARKLKPGGRLVWQVQLEGANWRSEREWRADDSLVGKVKFRYALHCFARTEAQFAEALMRHGFTHPVIVPIAQQVKERFDDVCEQHLLAAERCA